MIGEKLLLVEESLFRAMTNAYHKVMAMEESDIKTPSDTSKVCQDYLDSWGLYGTGTWKEFIEDSMKRETEVIPVNEEETVFVLKNYQYKGE